MRTFLFSAMTVAAALGFLAKLRDLKREPHNLFLRWLCALLGLVAASSFVGIPPIFTFLQTSTGLSFWVIALSVASVGAGRSTLLLWAYPLEQAVRKVYQGVVSYALAITGILVLCVLGRGLIAPEVIIATEQAPEFAYVDTPYVREAFLIFCAVNGVTYIDTALRLRRVANLVDRRWLRRAMRTLVTSVFLGLGYCVGFAGYVVAHRLGADLPILQSTAMLCAALATVGTPIGISLPLLGPRWDRMRAYRRLRPLWAALRGAAPDVVLEAPRLSFLDGWNPWTIDYRLYRRAIEIRDGIQLLRGHFTPGVEAAADRLGHEAGQSRRDLETTIVAAQLLAAIERRRRGCEPGDRMAARVTGETGHDLDAELRVLVPLARAFTSTIAKKAVRATAG